MALLAACGTSWRQRDKGRSLTPGVAAPNAVGRGGDRPSRCVPIGVLLDLTAPGLFVGLFFGAVSGARQPDVTLDWLPLE